MKKEQHNGLITTSYLPALEDTALKDGQNSITKKNISILIVEYDFISFLYLEAVINLFNYKIIHVKNGQDAVDLMRQDNLIALIFMELKIPVLDGFETTKQIRKVNKKIPIIAQTTLANLIDRQKAFEVGCTDYLLKPISKELLCETIKKYVS